MKYKDYKIGEEFEYNGIKLIVKEGIDSSCDGCFFNTVIGCLHNDLICMGMSREDGKNVIAEEKSFIKKVE